MFDCTDTCCIGSVKPELSEEIIDQPKPLHDQPNKDGPPNDRDPTLRMHSERPLVIYQAIGGRPAPYFQLPVVILLRQFFEPAACRQLSTISLDGELQRRIAEQSTEAVLVRASVIPMVRPWLEQHILHPRCVFTGSTTLFSRVDRGPNPPIRTPGSYSRARPSIYICLSAPPTGAMFFTPGYPIGYTPLHPGDAVLCQSTADEFFNYGPGQACFLRLYGELGPYFPPAPSHADVMSRLMSSGPPAALEFDRSPSVGARQYQAGSNVREEREEVDVFGLPQLLEATEKLQGGSWEDRDAMREEWISGISQSGSGAESQLSSKEPEVERGASRKRKAKTPGSQGGDVSQGSIGPKRRTRSNISISLSHPTPSSAPTLRPALEECADTGNADEPDLLPAKKSKKRKSA